MGLFQFSESELGRACSGGELEEVLRAAYGTRTRGTGGRLLFAESVDQLEPEGEEVAQQREQQAQRQQQQPRRQQAVPVPAVPQQRQPLAEGARDVPVCLGGDGDQR